MKQSRLAIVVACLLAFAGIMHCARPELFNEIVPPWLPPSQSFWTYISGISELIIAALLVRRSTRRAGAICAVWLFIAVYPANLYMTWDWRNEAFSQQFIAWARLPFQFLFIWVALRIAHPKVDHPIAPGDIS